jgi:hypothetical protein
MVAREATKKSGHLPGLTYPDCHCQLRPQQFLYFLPLPQGQGSFLPIFTRFTGVLLFTAGDPLFFSDMIATIS